MSSCRKPGDWDCRTCQHMNFRSRDTCHFCGLPRVGPDELGGCLGRPPAGADIVKPGDWYCICGIHNFASRTNCFKCGTYRDETAVVNSGGLDADKICEKLGYDVRAGWKSGDWICARNGCNVHNFASRMECYRCNAPRSYGDE